MSNMKKINRDKKIDELMFRFSMLNKWKNDIFEFCKKKDSIKEDEIQESISMFTSDLKGYYNTIILYFKDEEGNDDKAEVINLLAVCSRINDEMSLGIFFDINKALFYVLPIKYIKESEAFLRMLKECGNYVKDPKRTPNPMHYNGKLIIFSAEMMAEILGTTELLDMVLYYSINTLSYLVDKFEMDIPSTDSTDVVFFRKLEKKYGSGDLFEEIEKEALDLSLTLIKKGRDQSAFTRLEIETLERAESLK